ncbi:DUF885 family protein [Sphingomonas sp.]|uniref:DUF885 family protein n=1 Tax=Sphingomonas sp. TaxID=28214 RepID=UPI003B00F964
MRLSRREALVMGAAALAWPARGATQGPCPSPEAIDAACAPLVALLPEAATRAGVADRHALALLDDQSTDGDAALALATAAALAAIPQSCVWDAASIARAPLAAADATRNLRYGRNDPTAAIHRPYRITGFAGPHIETPRLLALVQPADTPEAAEAWLARLDGHADALMRAAESLRADEAAGCLPPVAVGRGALATLDAIAATTPGANPLVRFLADPAVAARAREILARRVKPAAALLRDTVAALTRRGVEDQGVWRQPGGEALHAANLARAGDTGLSTEAAQGYARDEVTRIAALLDRRLAVRGFRDGSIDARIAAAFADRPAFVAGDDEEGRSALVSAARGRIEAAHAVLGRIVPPALAATPPLGVAPLPDAGRMWPAGSSYGRAAYGREATLWLDVRSVYALPIPGVSPLACRLGLPGEHLLASASDTAVRPLLAKLCAWPAITAGWRGYAARLSAEAGLFARDPWGDIARLADELAAAARLVVDVGIHQQRWTRERAEAEMTAMTGAPQAAAIDRIVALPGEAAAETLGLHRLLSLREQARGTAKHADTRAFHQAVLSGGARPFALIERDIAMLA